MTQLYTNELVSLEKKIEYLDVTSGNCKEFDLDFLYDLDRCKSWIKENNLKKVCLQFPDYLLHDAAKVVKLFESSIDQHFYILGDTSYESCCIDYVAAAHVRADGIIHFGQVCFSKPSESIPTLIVHEKTKFDLDKLFNAFAYKFQKSGDVALVLDAPFIYKKDQLMLIQDINSDIKVYAVTDNDIQVEDCRVLYLGDNNRKLMLFNMLYKPKELYYYNNSNPETVQTYSMDTKAIKRRAYLLEVIKDSKTVGIIVGTVAVKNYKVIIQRMMKLCKLHNKKYYLISVGKPTVAKLANYPELDVYVLIGCPMNNIIESRDFYKPIVTPYDVEIALNPKADNVQYHDLTQLAENNDDLDDIIIDNCDVSLLSGKLRTVEKTVNDENCEHCSDKSLALKGDDRLVAHSTHGAEYLNSRTWTGLEQNLGETKVEHAEEGRKGVAQSYDTEPNT